MQEHIRRILKCELSGYYCEKCIPNEFVELRAEKINFKIISCAQNAKYFP
jgi:hypothetical protein